MLLKETDTIDAILIMVLEQIKFVIQTGSSRRHVWILFRYQCLPPPPRHG